MSRTLLVVIIIVVVLIILVGGYFIFFAKGGPLGITTGPNTNIVCVSNWQCNWGPCVNGSQSQFAIDLNSCGTGQSTIVCPALARVCTNPPVNLSAAVSIKNFAFNPTPLTIKVGTTVTWTNNDSTAHQIKSNTFNSAVLNPGQNFKFTFSNTGSFDYSCAIHPFMTGKIVVTN